MSKLVHNSSLINWPLETVPDDLKQSRHTPAQNLKNECKVHSLKDNSEGWRKHLNNQCMCKECTCGKHMCQLQRMKPFGKHGQSNYKLNYKKPERMKTHPTKFQEQFSPSKGVVKESTYHSDYKIKDILTKEKILGLSDNLQIGGPFFVGTTYKQEYYPKISANSGEIRMLSNNIFAMNVPLKVKSSYNDNYRKHDHILTESFKPNPRANKSMSLDYTKGTTYRDQFKLPSIDAYKRNNYQQRMNNEEEIDHINKKSEYQASFQPNAVSVCPALEKAKQSIS